MTKLCVKDGVTKLCVKVRVCDKAVCERECMTKLCVKVRVCDNVECDKGGGGSGRSGIQNQKQEPHTKMWGKKMQNYSSFGSFQPSSLFRLFHGMGASISSHDTPWPLISDQILLGTSGYLSFHQSTSCGAGAYVSPTPFLSRESNSCKAAARSITRHPWRITQSNLPC